MTMTEFDASFSTSDAQLAIDHGSRNCQRTTRIQHEVKPVYRLMPGSARGKAALLGCEAHASPSPSTPGAHSAPSTLSIELLTPVLDNAVWTASVIMFRNSSTVTVVCSAFLSSRSVIEDSGRAWTSTDPDGSCGGDGAGAARRLRHHPGPA